LEIVVRLLILIFCLGVSLSVQAQCDRERHAVIQQNLEIGSFTASNLDLQNKFNQAQNDLQDLLSASQEAKSDLDLVTKTKAMNIKILDFLDTIKRHAENIQIEDNMQKRLAQMLDEYIQAQPSRPLSEDFKDVLEQNKTQLNPSSYDQLNDLCIEMGLFEESHQDLLSKLKAQMIQGRGEAGFSDAMASSIYSLDDEIKRLDLNETGALNTKNEKSARLNDEIATKQTYISQLTAQIQRKHG
jgi:hypothetical protein